MALHKLASVDEYEYAEQASNDFFGELVEDFCGKKE